MSQTSLAASRFAAIEKKPFHFLHCWAILKDQPKWMDNHMGQQNQHGNANPTCWGLVLKCYESRTRQHKMLNVKALRPSGHYFPSDIMNLGRRL
jgi:hypothetical protein